MHQIIKTSLLIFTLILGKSVYSQVIWQETFDTPDKGYWVDSSGQLVSDLSNINWTVNISNAVFLNENDYAKTVSTSGGRFEVVDSDGDVIWISDSIPISTYDAINISLDANETGSGSDQDNKYIKAFYKIDNDNLVSFSPDSIASGNWGNVQLVQKALYGNWLQLVVKMNSSYSNDKIIIDNILVEAIDSSKLVPSKISRSLISLIIHFKPFMYL